MNVTQQPPMRKDTARITFDVPANMKRYVEAKAREEGETMATFFRLLIKQMMNTQVAETVPNTGSQLSS